MANVRAIQRTYQAFAAIRDDGSVVTWGRADYGGDSSAVQGRLQNVTAVQSTRAAFAAILSDGSVVTWGGEEHGGDSSAVQDRLKACSCSHIAGNKRAFAAILSNGSVVTWGEAEAGGDSSAVQDQLKNVKAIQASDRAFAAIAGAEDNVITWGVWLGDWPPTPPRRKSKSEPPGGFGVLE